MAGVSSNVERQLSEELLGIVDRPQRVDMRQSPPKSERMTANRRKACLIGQSWRNCCGVTVRRHGIWAAPWPTRRHLGGAAICGGLADAEVSPPRAFWGLPISTRANLCQINGTSATEGVRSLRAGRRLHPRQTGLSLNLCSVHGTGGSRPASQWRRIRCAMNHGSNSLRLSSTPQPMRWRTR